MNDIEDQLRDAYRAVGQAIRPETIRPQVLPEHHRSTRFVPLAAAAAVIVVIAGAVTVPHLLKDSPATASPASPATSTAARPSYLADLIPPWIELRDPATGTLLSRTPPPASGAWQGLAAIDGGTKFFVETSSGDYCNGRPFKIYTLTPGKPDRLKPYMTLPGFIEGFTASADGGTLAYLTNPCRGGKPDANTEILSVVRNGATRDWTIPASVSPGSLSLSADGSELGYVNFTIEGQRGAASVLPTSSPPGSLTTWSHHVFAPAPHGQQAEGLVLSPDGRTTYLLTVKPNQSVETYTLSAYDTATGAQLRTLHTWRIGTRILATGEVAMTANGIHMLILYLHLTSIDEVNLATGAARWFEQLRDGTGDVMAVAW